MKLLYITLSMLSLVACTKPQEEAVKTATENLELSLDTKNGFEVSNVSPVDSAFGQNYITPKELEHIFRALRKGTQQVVSMTNRADGDLSPKLIARIERQMRANNEVRDLLLKPHKKGSYSGYRLHITYKAKDMRGYEYMAERWSFVDPEGKQVLRSFDIPLPEKPKKQ